MSTAKKKVVIRRFVGELLTGYMPLTGFTRGAGTSRTLEVLDLSGRLVSLPAASVKTVSFVRDFNLADTVNPERLTRQAFLARPRSEGLWVRLTFRPSERGSERNAELLEGLAASDLALADSLIEDGGFAFAPPDVRSNTQWIFVPRTAIESLQILAVITTPSKVKPKPTRTSEEIRKEMQENLFDVPTPPNSRPN